ncbi:3565_t:CDS:2 [Gigaspora rosea]|nr:3564_t:CDS:2 [Gigaspora rosea]CAG8450984.1 3565_t:CDS:2 [Gigaspora rosea]
MLKQLSKTFGNHDNNKAPHDHEAPSGHENPKGHHKVAPITGDFILASLHIRRTDSQVLLVNAFDDLEVISRIK